MQNLVIIPTYNESENIVTLINEIFEQVPSTHILVVDDGSPDGTGQLVKDLMLNSQQVHLLENKGKGGLGKAYIQGFVWALDNNYTSCVQMDADFSHRPQDLKKIVTALEHHPLVVGSRYVPGGGTANWSWYRKLISRFGSLYSRMILGYPLNDWTGGFNGWRREVLESIDLKGVRSEGYSFQIEMKYRAIQKDYQPYEQPILFEERREGASKMSMAIVIEAFYRVWQIRLGVQ
jgi:dolichol-phosphate mannosyltransferase